jgi:DNA modification methylase
MDELALYGYDLFGEPVQPERRGALSQRFEFPPFSVLNARDGSWQDRKRAWLSLGIVGELGRDVTTYSNNWAKEHGIQGNCTRMESNYASVFDPVLCELTYRWWAPAGGQIVDPFAGGSVRGIVAGLLGYRYHGIELRAEQIVANRAQCEAITPYAPVEWVAGDAMDCMDDAPLADLIFTCPPYGDLERYSDDPRDLSTMEYHTFIAAYRRIILRCAKTLKPNSLACFVVGDFRDRRTGMYRGFVADTISACRDVGLDLYNDAVLLTSIGNLPIRVGRQFASSRKLGKAHQNVLVFTNGTPRLAKTDRSNS